METSDSDANHAVLHAKTAEEGWVPIETSNSDVKPAVVHALSDRSCLEPIETCYSGPEGAVLHPKTTREGWVPWRLVILMLITLFSMHTTTGDVWDP